MSRVGHSPLTVAIVVLLVACLLLGPGGFPYGRSSADGGSADRTLPVYLPLLISWGVRVLPNHSWYVSTIGSMWIVGEVQNDTDQFLELVRITATVYDADEQILATALGYVDLNRLPPGDKSCFDILVGREPSGWTAYEFGPPLFQTTTGPVLDLSTLNDSGSYDPASGRYQIVGQVRNDHSTRVEHIEVVGSLYTDSGVVAGCHSRLLEGAHLDPGQLGPFDLIFSGRNYLDVASYRLQLDGTPQQPGGDLLLRP